MEYSRRGLARNKAVISKQRENIWVNLRIFSDFVCQKAIEGTNEQIYEFLTCIFSHARMGTGVVSMKRDLPWIFTFLRSKNLTTYAHFYGFY